MSRSRKLASAFSALPGPLRGAIWMLVAAGWLAGMNGIIRVLSEELHPFEIVFLRNVASFSFMVPWVVRSGIAAMRTTNHRLFISRSLVSLVSMLAWFSAVTMMPLAEATALGFTAPLFATIIAVLVLREVVRIRRWSATIIGFLGVMIVVRPGFETLTLPQLLVLASSFTGALTTVLTKQLTKTESANAIVTYMTLYIIPVSLIPALFVWSNPSLWAWGWIALLGLCATLGHQCLTRAFASADASAVVSFDFARLPFVAVIAWFGFGEKPDVWTWVGAAVIAASSAYIAHREATLSRAARGTPTPVAPATPEAGAIASGGTGIKRDAACRDRRGGE